MIRYAQIVPATLSLCACLAVAAVLPAGAAFPGKNGRLAFAVPDGGAALISVKANGRGRLDLSGDVQGSEYDPSYSADGSRIAFIFSRDDPRLKSDVYVMDADGTNVTNVTDTPGRQEATPTFAPDGRRIGFATRDGIRSIALDGSDEKFLGKGGLPSYSPDGKSIAFSHRGDVWVMDSDGDNPRNLTMRYRSKGTGDVSFLCPSFSPDGSRIILNANLSNEFPDSPFQDDLYALKANGRNLLQLTATKFDEFCGTFSPDGRQIAYVGDTDRGARHDGIYVARIDGTNGQRVYKVKRPGPPSWQPLP